MEYTILNLMEHVGRFPLPQYYYTIIGILWTILALKLPYGQIAINIGFQFVYKVGEYDTAVDRGNVYTVCDL